jgi:hypothetical protein
MQTVTFHVDTQFLIMSTLRERERDTLKVIAQQSEMVSLLNAEGGKAMRSVRLHCDMRKRSFALSDQLSISRRRLLTAFQELYW